MTNQTTQHTPTPWHVGRQDSTNTRDKIFDAQGWGICRVDYPKRDAAFVVEACNSHAANVARIAELEAALRGLVQAEEEYGDESNVAVNQALAPAYAALKGAK